MECLLLLPESLLGNLVSQGADQPIRSGLQRNETYQVKKRNGGYYLFATFLKLWENIDVQTTFVDKVLFYAWKCFHIQQVSNL